MKKTVLFTLALCLLLSVTGCSLPEMPGAATEPAEKVFTVDTYQLQLTADSSFQENTAGSFDLQITNGQCYISIMAYSYIDLPQDTTPADVYEMQNQDLFGKREHVTAVEDTVTQAPSGALVSYGLYSAERDGTKNYYATYLMDFPDGETFAWVLVTSAPSYMEANREMLHNYVCSLTPIA